MKEFFFLKETEEVVLQSAFTVPPRALDPTMKETGLFHVDAVAVETGPSLWILELHQVPVTCVKVSNTDTVSWDSYSTSTWRNSEC